LFSEQLPLNSSTNSTDSLAYETVNFGELYRLRRTHPKHHLLVEQRLGAMDSVLRQSKAMCPFMRKATAASLRAMSISVRPSVVSSPCGGTMSKLQVLARRCPVMGKAMAVQSARMGKVHGAAAAGFGGVAGLHTISMSGHAKTGGKARLHTSRTREAQAVEGPLYNGRETGE
jgi:5-aminolevulinate synthase